MLKWATSLVLVLVMGAGVLAGVPLHLGGHGCSDMECCVAGMESAPSHHSEEPAGLAADLYCFVNCREPAAPARIAGPGNNSPSARADRQPVSVQAPLAAPPARPRRRGGEARRQDSHPIYLRYLALLI